MTNNIAAIYGGTFDPPTNGHYHIIEKAAKIFDKVYVVVASNPDKKNYMFSTEERVEMLKEMVKVIIENNPLKIEISIEVLPQNTYLSSFANQKSHKSVLIRGIRDEIDFSYEQKICRTNKLIQPNIETIYIMPDDSCSLVSSSWIKGLIGCKGWRNIIAQNTPPIVTLKIKENYLKQIFYNLSIFENKNDKDRVWEDLCSSYKNRNYHNYDHLISLFEICYDFPCFTSFQSPNMFSAIFLHDWYDSVDECIRWSKYFGMSLEVMKFIEATRHTTEEYKSKEEQFISSIDLLILASSQDKYQKYVNNIYKEYVVKKNITLRDWNKGRSEFLTNMLKRKNIFTFDLIRNNKNYSRENMTNEEAARENMKKELELY